MFIINVKLRTDIAELNPKKFDQDQILVRRVFKTLMIPLKF